MIEIKKPNIKVPAGHELIYNEWGKKWVMRPIKGYSEKYLRPVNRFIPPKNVKETVDEVVEGISTKNNTALNNAKSNKNDEFYTLLSVIEEEVGSYKEYFKGKIVYCPCDKVYNDYRSNFAEYFIRNFHTLGLKKLICTQFNPTGKGTLTEYDFDTCGVGWEYDGHMNPCESFDESDINTYFLKGNGSFDSDECKAIMQKCDVIVTNPPFSLFRPFMEQVMDMGKKFLVIGNMNAITYKEIVPHILSDNLWMGHSGNNGMYFIVPESHTYVETYKFKKEIDGQKVCRMGNVCWFTNIPSDKENPPIETGVKYDPNRHLNYTNMDGIECPTLADIPMDYDGVMGVPITYLFKHCPSQFKIVGYTNSPQIGNEKLYKRLLIQKR